MRDWGEMQRRAQAGKEHDPAPYRIHRRLSFHLTRPLLETGVSADAVSLAMLVTGAAGVAAMAAADPPVNVAGALLLYLAFLLDKVDGEIARCRGVTSVRGIALDRFHHRLVEPGLFAAAAIHAQRHDASPATIVAAAACMLFANAIEENQQLAPYVLYKHLRGGGALPPPVAEPAWIEWLGRALRPLRALRMHIVALPAIGLAYVVEAATGVRATRAYLEASAAGLGAYLVFQCVDYAVARMAREGRQAAAVFAREHARDPRAWSALAAPPADVTTVPPRSVSAVPSADVTRPPREPRKAPPQEVPSP